MDWLDVCFLCLVFFLLLWFFEKICIWGIYFLARGKVTVSGINLRGIHNVQVKLKSVHFDAKVVYFNYRDRHVVVTIEGLDIIYHPLITQTNASKKKQSSHDPTELRNFYLPSPLYYVFKFVRFEVADVKLVVTSRSLNINLQHLVLKGEREEKSPSRIQIVALFRAIRISKFMVEQSEQRNIFTCFEVSFQFIFEKESYSFTTRYKLWTVDGDIKEPVISLKNILNIKNEAALYNVKGSLKPKFKFSPELLVAYFHHNFLRQLSKASKLPPVITINTHCFKLEDILPDIESSLCTFTYMQATITILDKQTIHCKCSIPQFECHFTEKSVSTLLIQNFNLISDITARSISARLGFAELDSQLHVRPDEDSFPMVDSIPISLECSHSVEVSTQVAISEESYTRMEPTTKYSKQEFLDLDLDVKLSFEAFINDFNVTTYGASENSPHFCLKEFKFMLNGSNFVFRYCLYGDVIKICTAPFVIDAFMQSLKRIMPRKASNIRSTPVGSPSPSNEKSLRDSLDKGSSHKLSLINEFTSIKVIKSLFLSDPDPAGKKIHKISLSVSEVSREFVDYAEFKFANFCVSVHHDDRIVNLVDASQFSLNELASPWKSIDAKLKSFSSDWDPSSHMTVFMMVKCYSALKNSLKKSPEKSSRLKSRKSIESKDQLVSWKVDSKMRNLPLVSFTCKTFSIHARTLDPGEVATGEEPFSNTFELALLEVSVSPSAFGMKCSTFNVFCDRNMKKVVSPLSRTINGELDDDGTGKKPSVEPIFVFKGFFLQYSSISATTNADREKFSLSSKNHMLTMEVDSCNIKFPDGYVFHRNFSQFTLARKWLKALHYPSSSSNPASNTDSPVSSASIASNTNSPVKKKSTFVWPDFNFTITTFTMSIDDNLFEQRLSENYRLLLDEKVEQTDRFMIFEEKWQQVCLNSPPEMCNEESYERMLMQLLQMNSRLYIERWKKSRDYFQSDGNLVCLTLSNWQILCLADEEMTGRENIIRQMNELDGTTTVPEEIQFSAQACRIISVTAETLSINVRDYPDPMYAISNGNIAGKFLVAIPRAENTFSYVDYSLGPHFEPARLKRNPGSQKWFQNLSMTCDQVTFNWGQNRDPGWNEVSHGMALINKPSADPSPPLPFWDKARLKCQGKLLCYYKELEITWLCTLDPYKQSEKLRLLWKNVHFDWIPNNLSLSGDLKVVIQTASKSPLTFIDAPRTRMSWNFVYNCLGNPTAHHAVAFRPQNIYLEDYDTYSRFRSQSFDVTFSISIRPSIQSDMNTAISDETLLTSDLPLGTAKVDMSSSTFNWFHQFSKLLGTTSRPIRRGRFYNNVRTRKKASLMRHFRNFITKFDTPAITYNYRVSEKRNLGITMYFSSDSRLRTEQSLYLEPHDDRLIRRPATRWVTRSLIFDLSNLYIFVISDNSETEDQCSLMDAYIKEKRHTDPPMKLHFLSIQTLSYQKTEIAPNTVRASASGSDEVVYLTPMHSLSAAGVHATWSRRNRAIIMRLYDQYSFNKSLRQNLSSDALKPIIVVSNEDPKSKIERRKSVLQPSMTHKRPSVGNSLEELDDSDVSSSQTPAKHNPFADPLYEILVKDIDSKRFFGFNEEKYIPEDDEDDEISLLDVNQHELKVAVSDMQLKMLGFDTPGLIIVTASDAQIDKYQHEPQWYEDKLYSKNSLVVSLNDMQYFSTLSYNDLVACEENDETVSWLPLNIVNIESQNLSKSMEEQSFQEEVLTEAIGALVSSCGSYRLQRIISRCCCNVSIANVKALSESDNMPIYNVPSKKQVCKKAPVSLFRLHHNDLCISTNSFQYSLVLDIVNNLILYQEKSRKISNENLKILRLSMQVREFAELKLAIINMQKQLRDGNFLLKQLKREKVATENKVKSLQLSLAKQDPETDPETLRRLEDEITYGKSFVLVQEQGVQNQKDELEAAAQRLQLALTCYKELQLKSKIHLPGNDEVPVASNKKEIIFAKAKWSLTEVDGQIGFADVCLTNFKYTKISRNDDSLDHRVSLEDVEVKNLINNDHFVDILQTHEKNARNASSSSDLSSQNDNDELSPDNDRGMILVVQMREKPAVGGIQIRELLDIKIATLNIHLTEAFWKTMKQFLFPVESKRKQEEEELHQMRLLTTALPHDKSSSKLILNKSGSSSYSLSSALATKNKKKKVKKESKDRDFEKLYSSHAGTDSIDLAFERAARNCMFVMIRIREVPLYVTYRGDKKKNIEDIHNMHIVLPRVEIHNMTMTWRDLLNHVRSEVTKTIVKGWMQEKLRLGAYRNSKMLTDEDQAALMIDKEKLRKLNEHHLSKSK